MKRLLDALADNRLTVAGFAVLAAAVLAAHVWARLDTAWVALPLVLLALNLAAALVRHPLLRRGGLAVFHGALLGCLLLVAWGRLTHLEGRVEIAEGTAFDAAAVELTSQGPWPGVRLSSLQFAQGPFQVRYGAQGQRGRTTSLVALPGGDWRSVGDDRPLVLEGVRFYTTHNKGFAPVLRWQAPGAAPVVGHLHLPSYPLFDWKQEQTWQAAGGPLMRFALRVAAPPAGQAWELRPESVPHVLVLQVGDERFELRPGEAARGAFGELRYERMAGWMGYRLHFDPTIAPLFWLALLGVAGLAAHWWAPRRARAGALQGATA